VFTKPPPVVAKKKKSYQNVRIAGNISIDFDEMEAEAQLAVGWNRIVGRNMELWWLSQPLNRTKDAFLKI
jgi:hypothetical protein